MPDRADGNVLEITLDDFPRHVGLLLGNVARSGFVPDVVIFVERAGRIPGVLAARALGCSLIPLHLQRKGTRWKHRLAPIAAALPRWLAGKLRKIEAALAFRKIERREVIAQGPSVNLSGKRVLIIDDAADTGSSLLQGRAWTIAHGAEPKFVKTAALTVTTELASAAVDFFVYRAICRFPSSSDSRDARRYEQVYAEFAEDVRVQMFEN